MPQRKTSQKLGAQDLKRAIATLRRGGTSQPKTITERQRKAIQVSIRKAKKTSLAALKASQGLGAKIIVGPSTSTRRPGGVPTPMTAQQEKTFTRSLRKDWRDTVRAINATQKINPQTSKILINKVTNPSANDQDFKTQVRLYKAACRPMRDTGARVRTLAPTL